MRTFLLIAFISLSWAFRAMADAGEFKLAEELQVGKSNAFELSKTDRAVIKLTENDYILFELLDSNHEDGTGTFTEVCTVIWTRIGPDDLRGGTAKGYIRYERKKKSENQYDVNRIGGSDQILLGEYPIQWSYASRNKIYLYPEAGTRHATTKIAQ